MYSAMMCIAMMVIGLNVCSPCALSLDDDYWLNGCSPCALSLDWS